MDSNQSNYTLKTVSADWETLFSCNILDPENRENIVESFLKHVRRYGWEIKLSTLKNLSSNLIAWNISIFLSKKWHLKVKGFHELWIENHWLCVDFMNMCTNYTPKFILVYNNGNPWIEVDFWGWPSAPQIIESTQIAANEVLFKRAA